MLRALSIRDFVVVESLDVDFAPGFTVLTGETGAGKSILLDALALLLGDRFETRQLRPGVERAELAATFDVDSERGIASLLEASGSEGTNSTVAITSPVALRPAAMTCSYTPSGRSTVHSAWTSTSQTA